MHPHHLPVNVALLTGRSISLKMIVAPPLPDEFPDLPSYVNSFLPEQIRVWGFVRAMKSFQARTWVFIPAVKVKR